jgi:hypothetical protein
VLDPLEVMEARDPPWGDGLRAVTAAEQRPGHRRVRVGIAAQSDRPAEPALGVVDALERHQPSRLAALLPDVVVGSGIEPAFGRDVADVGGLAAVVEEAAQGRGEVAWGGAEDLLVLLVGAHPGGLVARALVAGAQKSGDPRLDSRQGDVAVARGLDVDARRFVQAGHGVSVAVREEPGREPTAA